jgi:DNA-binding IscR family transcriptional regulator
LPRRWSATDELEALRIRDEVLQAMYWMRSEGLAESPTAEELARFLAVPSTTLAPYLERFAADGFLEAAAGGYRLTARGEETGKQTFADEFADMTKPGHGECDEDCWCHESPEEAARCLEERTGEAHVH